MQTKNQMAHAKEVYLHTCDKEKEVIPCADTYGGNLLHCSCVALMKAIAVGSHPVLGPSLTVVRPIPRPWQNLRPRRPPLPPCRRWTSFNHWVEMTVDWACPCRNERRPQHRWPERPRSYPM